MPVRKKIAAFQPEVHPRIRILSGKVIAFGPGKAELLNHLEKTRSLNQAAKRMGMSYMKAWLLVQIMNRSYRHPLVKTERGGVHGGGAELTETGRQVLDLYRQMEVASRAAMIEPWKRMRRLLAPADE